MYYVSSYSVLRHKHTSTRAVICSGGGEVFMFSDIIRGFSGALIGRGAGGGFGGSPNCCRSMLL